MSRVDIVIPVHDRDRERFRLLERSLTKFWRLSGNINVISQDNERELLGNFVGPGWYCQQVLKIAATARGSAEFALILDADCLAVKTITHETLFDGERARMPRMLVTALSHAKWYAAAARLLDFDTDVAPSEFHKAPYTSVTPLVLSRTICRKLIDALGGETRWRRVLTGTGEHWSEYALYYLTAWKFGLFDQYHVAKSGTFSTNCIWFPKDAGVWKLLLEEEVSEPFSVLQSTAVEASWVEARVGHLL